MKFTNSLKIKSDFALHVSCSLERISCDTISFPNATDTQGTPIPHDELVSALAHLYRYVAEQLDISYHDLEDVISKKLDTMFYGSFELVTKEIPDTTPDTTPKANNADEA